MPIPLLHLPTPPRRLPGVLLLVLALLWAQLLGLGHGVRHAAPAAQAAQELQAPASDLLAHLLAPAGDEDECRLYDQLGHGAPLLALSLLAIGVLPVSPVWAVLPPPRPWPCVAFSARAPPRSR